MSIPCAVSEVYNQFRSVTGTPLPAELSEAEEVAAILRVLRGEFYVLTAVSALGTPLYRGPRGELMLHPFDARIYPSRGLASIDLDQIHDAPDDARHLNWEISLRHEDLEV